MNWTVLGISAAALAVAVVAFVLYKYIRIILNIFLDVLITSPPRPYDMGGEEVRFRSLDGLALFGMFLPARGRALGTVVFCHEFGANGASVAEFGAFLRERFHVFTFDFRAHGQSTQPPGYRPHQWPSTHEVYDVLGALACVRSRPEAEALPVGLFGISRGGAAALCAAARNPHVRAVVVDGAFATRSILDAYMRRWIGIYSNLEFIYRRIPDWVYTGIRMLALFVAHVKLRRRFPSIQRAVRQLSPRAVFFIHGARDSFVDQSQAAALYARARQPKQLWIVPRARHNESIKVAPDEYRRRVMAFFTTFLGPITETEPADEAVRGAVPEPAT